MDISYPVIVISGLSGSGKTTLGKLFVAKHQEYVLIDQDTFFLKDKPKVKLSTGEIVSNWDTVDALNWDSLNCAVNQARRYNPVMFTGFAPWTNRITFPVALHIHLSYDLSGVNAISRCITARCKSKGFIDSKKRERDELMVHEIIYPFYIETLRNSDIDFMLPVFDESSIKHSSMLNKRVDIKVLLEEIERLIDNINT